ncbi:MAG: hypothetical protein H7329_00670 [Opitutaceae bacterium]|nr:hypothetical protein [Cytophagales bacterium]
MGKKLMKISVVLVYCFTSFIAFDSFSQISETTHKTHSDSASHSFVKIEKIDKFYTKEELNKLPKLDLIAVYKSRLTYLIEVLPFISLHPEPGSTFHDMAIPETEANIAHLDKETKNKQAFVKSLSQTLDDVIPYSEKSNIIWSIMFFDEMIKKSDYTNTGKSKK